MAHVLTLTLLGATPWSNESKNFEVSATWVADRGTGVRLGGSLEFGRIADTVGLGLRFGMQPVAGLSWSSPPTSPPPLMWLTAYVDFEARVDFTPNLGLRASAGVVPSLDLGATSLEKLPNGTWSTSTTVAVPRIGAEATLALRFRSDDMPGSGLFGIGVYLGLTGALGLFTLGAMW